MLLALVALLGPAFLGVTPVFEQVKVANACSCGDCDFVSGSPLVVRGTVDGWDYLRDADGVPIERLAREDYSRPEYFPRERPLELRLRVETVFKGAAPAEVVVRSGQFDRYLRAEGSPPFGYWAWPGEAGECFGLASDPTGQDLLVILAPTGEPGSYRFVVGPHPFEGGVSQAILGRFPELSPRPPSAGNSPPSEPAAAGSDDWMFISAIGAGSLLITLVLLIAGPRREAAHRQRRPETDDS